MHSVLYVRRKPDGLTVIIPLSITRGALGPTNIATAPAPPVGRARPLAYTAISAATTRAKRPETNSQHSLLSAGPKQASRLGHGRNLRGRVSGCSHQSPSRPRFVVFPHCSGLHWSSQSRHSCEQVAASVYWTLFSGLAYLC